MLTLDTLKACGVNTDEGVARCAGLEDFYIDLVKSVLNTEKTDELESNISSGDLKAAFETAHSMKGMYANLSLDPLTRPVSEMTELLRAGTQTDYTPYLAEIKAQMSKLIELL